MDASELNSRIGRAINIGNALEAPREGDWGVVIQDAFFQQIKDAGFKAVRLPVKWNAHAASAAPFAVDPAFFARVDHVIGQALSRDLAVVLDFHNYDEMMQDPAASAPRFLAIWQQIAEHYRTHPGTLLFELLNEPNTNLGAKAWNTLINRTLSVVRVSNPARNIVVGPVQWNNFHALPDLALPAGDHHLIVSFHYYDPFQFTHQGAEWVAGSDAWLGTNWAGKSADRQSLAYDFDVVAQWARANDRPIFLGEFGAYHKADMAARVRWTAYVARQAEERQFSWAYLEFCSGFGIYDQNSGLWNQALREALIPPP
jgi:endoglucanase